MKQVEVARPYAKAAFQYAKSASVVSAFGAALDLWAEFVSTPAGRQYLQHPKVKIEDVLEVLQSIFKHRLTQAETNFLRTLSYYKRLLVLPEIAALYHAYVRESESQLHAEVTSATELDSASWQSLQEALAARFHRSVEMTVAVDPELIGGVRVQVGDWVLDGSVKGRLSRLLTSLEG
ncbi:MAG: F0F1 ATP synthase subunit delta [Gammaproteobacteria bacterium]|nr:F0F1 ATP synthase subunit delta [Gammaproteobacteria bacterium]